MSANSEEDINVLRRQGERASNNTVIATATPTIQAAAYTAGQCVGSLLSFNGMGITGSLDGLLQSVSLFCKSAQTPSMDLVLFHTMPAASTFTDKATLVVNATDFDKLVDVVHLNDWISLGGPTYAKADNLAKPYRLSSSIMYGQLVARSAFTFASTSDIKLAVKALVD